MVGVGLGFEASISRERAPTELTTMMRPSSPFPLMSVSACLAMLLASAVYIVVVKNDINR